MKKLLLLPVTIICVLLAAAKLDAQPAVPPADTGLSGCLRKAGHVLDEALAFMQKNYYRRRRVDWEKLVEEAKKRLAASGNCNDTYDIISWCFTALDETHSFIMPPSRAAIYNNDMDQLPQAISISQLVGDIKGELLENGIAYLTIPWVSTTDSAVCMLVADSLQHLIARLDEKGTRGWIIDLRKNTGGNCWPMLAGVGPLLGDGICGYFIGSREKVPISYHNGAASQGKYVRCRVSGNAYTIKNHQPVIVLTGHRTVSSGEIVALAFKGREQTYLYGEPTAGYTTANATYTLSDNSMLVLSVCMEADRTGKICEGKIVPDEIIASEGPGLPDTVKQAAFSWLSSRL